MANFLLSQVLGLLTKITPSDFFHSNSIGARLLRPVINSVLPSKWAWFKVVSGPCRGMWLLINVKHDKSFILGKREEKLVEALCHALHPGASFWDIGAYNGYYSLLCSKLVGPAGRVLAIEPVPENAQRVRAAVEKNQLNNIQVVEIAVSSSEGITAIKAYGRTSITKSRELMQGLAEDLIEVPTTTMAKLIERFGPPDVVKIDVEGMEIDVLRGMDPVMREINSQIFIEFHSEELLSTARKMLSQYDFKPVDPPIHWWLSPKK